MGLRSPRTSFVDLNELGATETGAAMAAERTCSDAWQSILSIARSRT